MQYTYLAVQEHRQAVIKKKRKYGDIFIIFHSKNSFIFAWLHVFPWKLYYKVVCHFAIKIYLFELLLAV